MLLKWEPGGMKSEIARARGLGSARDGVKHWLHQRVTALANLVLTGWLAWGVSSLLSMRAGYEDAVVWLSQGIHPVLMILTILSVFYHAKLGLQIVIEDYVHQEGRKIATLTLMKMLIAAAVVACLYAVLKVTL